MLVDPTSAAQANATSANHQDIFDWLNRFLRYCQFKSVSDGHSAPNEKNRARYVENQRTNYKSYVEFIIAIKLHKQAIKICAIFGSSDDTASVKQYVAFNQKCQKIDH